MKKSVSKKKSGQSEIITTVLLILIVIAAIVIVWNVVLSFIRTTTPDSGILTANVQLTSTKLYMTGGADVQVKRQAGAGNITALKFLFLDKKGNSNSVKRESVVINELDTKTYSFSANELDFNNGDIVKVSVVPMLGSSMGSEASESDSQIKKDDFGNRILESPTGLISWWKFDGDYKDSIGGNHGTCTSCPNETADNRGNANGAFNFNSTMPGDFIQVNSNQLNNLGNPNSPYTISLWVYRTGSANYDIFTKPSVGPYPPKIMTWACAAYDGIAPIPPGLNPGVTFDAIGKPIPLNQWTHITCIFDSNIQNYMNGTLLATATNTVFSKDLHNSYPLLIGAGDNFGNGGFSGSIDNVMIFNRALSSAEVTALYNNQKI